MAKNNETLTLPKEYTLDKYYVVKDNSGKRTTKSEKELTEQDRAALKNNGVYAGGKTDLGDNYKKYVNFSLDNGKVTVSGPQDQLKSKVVVETKKLLKDNYTGADLTDKAVAESFQKVLDQVNEQVKANIQYEEYNKFLKSSGFSDAAYRNYAMAKTDADPNNSTNLLKSKNKYVGYKKDGKLTSKSEAMTAAEWFEYWKKNYTPEERIKLWIDSAEALSKGNSDEALYKGLPYILMGQHEDQNAVAGLLNIVNIFDDGKGWEDAKVFAPVNGFDDVDNWSVFWDSFASTNKEALGRFVKWAGGMKSPLERALGYQVGSAKTPEDWGHQVGLNGITGDMINNISRKEWNEAADIVNEFFYTKNKERLEKSGEGKSDAEILEEKYGKEKAAHVFLVAAFSTQLSTGNRDSGWAKYQQYRDLVKLQETEGYNSPYEKWGAEKEKEMGEHLQRLGTLSPSISSAGAVLGNVARMVGEQYLLGAATGGALTASNVAKTLTQGGWKLAKNALSTIGVGTEVLARAPAVAKAVSALAAGSGKGLAGAAKALYVTGAIGTWTIKEVGEDALRGLVDDVVTMNSLDSQGNLDPDKFVENVYMNAVVYGLAKLPKTAFKGLSSVVSNAKTRNIDGVELNATQINQLDQLQKALDESNKRFTYHGIDEGNHPVISSWGRTKVLDELTLSGPTATAVDEAAGVVSPTAARTVEDILENENLSDEIKQKVTDAIDDTKIIDDTTGELKEGWDDEIRTKIRETMTDDEIRQAFPNGMAKIGDDVIKIDTSEFTAADIGRVGGQNFKSMDDAIAALDTASKVNDFANAINGIMRQATNFAQDWKRAVQEFADANNMNVRDVMVAIRDSRIAGEETLPGLRELWENNWKPIQDKLLDVQEKITGVRPESHDFYFRDMLEGTFKPSASGAWAIDQGNATDILGGEAEFDLAASSFARNTGKLGEMASDKLEYDPEVLAREFVASRIQTIWESENGRAFATMQEAFDAGEFDFSEADAIKSVEATEAVAKSVDTSAGVGEINKLMNVEVLGDEFGEVEGAVKEMTAKEVDAAAKANKKQIVDAQKTFNDSASKSTSAEEISRNSGYKNRATRINAGPVVGVNYMPGDPFKGLSQWVNDQFVKANSIEIKWGNNTVSAYNGGYKMYAEAGTFARNVIIEIQRGSNLWDAIYKQIRNNGFFIEPSEYQIKKYGALTANEQAAKVTDKIMDRMSKGNYYYRWSDVFNDDGTVKSTEGLISVLTTRFRGQGINDFTKFLRKADWDSFSKGEQKWLNKRMYEMTASVNKKTFRGAVEGIMKASMGFRYKSNMWFNFKNGQLQLTECQRMFSMNKLGDFKATLKRLVSDGDYRQKVSDYTYSLAAESVGKGLSKADLDDITDVHTKVGAGSVITKNGISTDIDAVKAKFGEINDAALSSIEGGEYAKNYMLVAGFVAAGEKQGLEGVNLDNYVRNRFNAEALAGTKVGKIGLTDSRLGQFAFMYIGFPIRDLTLFWHNLRGGGLRGNAIGSLEYLAKMLGLKGVIWAAEAPWGYSLMQQLNLDPFGFSEQYNPINVNYEDRDPVWRIVDMSVEYNPFFQGAMTSAMADVYFSYRAAYETAREAYKEEHNGSTKNFEWSLADAGGEMWADLVKGLIPGYTAYSRVEGELSDLDRGYRISEMGNRLYEANTDPLNVGWGLVTGRRNTTNAQDYYQTANPIRGAVTGGLPGLGQQLERSDINIFRGFREFDPVDTDTYKDWFNGSYADQQNWNTGIYYFQEEAKKIRDKYDEYAKAGTAINDMNSRENELSDLRRRVEAYVDAYTEKHPEGISQTKQNQLINIFNLGDYQPTLDEAFQERQGNRDYSEWDAANNRYAQGNFPAAYGMIGPTTTNPDREYQYARSPQLEQILSENKYGINSEVAPIINQMYNDQKVSTPTGTKTMKEYHDEVYAQLQKEWDKSKPNYKNITKLQEKYIDVLSKNVIEPVLSTYGSGVLSAGKSSEIMQEFSKMLYGMVPSDQYRINKKGKTIYQSTPYMTIDIPKWMNANYKSYKSAKKTTDAAASSRLKDIRTDFNKGRTSTAKSKARALIQDIGAGKASLSRDELEWLQGVLK